MSVVWFIRHGESISNANLPTEHPASSPLTSLGELEARCVADVFTEKPSLITHSSYVRARQTAEPTIARFMPVNVEVWPVHEFTYLAPKRYFGTTLSERRPLAEAYWERMDPHFRDEGEGESFAAFLVRVQNTLTLLRQQNEPFVAVFSHGLFIGGILWALLHGLPDALREEDVTPRMMRRYSHFVRGMHIPNGSILAVTLNGRFAHISGIVSDHVAGLEVDEKNGHLP
ncbi:MAG: histidine phosphatase family protein [Chloroflexi bacterium]|nr:MAG: histidine phosphatase family protein [Chloroflexota bacterium]